MVLLGAMIIVLAVQSWRAYGQAPDDDAPSVTFVVDEGESFASVAARLDDEDLVASAFWFKVTAALTDRVDQLKPGAFVLQPDMNYTAILELLAVAQNNDVTLTIPEGYTLAQIGELVTTNFEITIDEWRRATGSASPQALHAFVVAAGKPDGVDLEGYLFPDTYRFFADAGVDEIVETLIDTTAARIAALGVPSGDASGMTTHDVLTLASIVEREVRTETSMKNVADIFLKRLAAGMPLQSDATINYVTGGDDPSVSLADLEIDSPYNTYMYPGLPPGAIGNPGLRAIAAVLAPTANPYYYFLTTDEGDIYYAVTFDEHVTNKAKYLR